MPIGILRDCTVTIWKACSSFPQSVSLPVNVLSQCTYCLLLPSCKRCLGRFWEIIGKPWDLSHNQNICNLDAFSSNKNVIPYIPLQSHKGKRLQVRPYFLTFLTAVLPAVSFLPNHLWWLRFVSCHIVSMEICSFRQKLCICYLFLD